MTAPNPADVELVADALARVHCWDGLAGVAAVLPDVAESFRSDAEAIVAALAGAGRLLPPDTDTRPETEYAIRSTLPNGTVWTSEPYYRREMAQLNAEAGEIVVERRIFAGPWLPVPSTQETPHA